MKQNKVGRFIEVCKRDKIMTTVQLAERLNVPAREVRKWEKGRKLPSADKMAELCDLFNINVNELLLGEKIDIRDYNIKTNQLLLELAKQDERKNKKIASNIFILMSVTLVFYISSILLALLLFKDEIIISIIIGVATVLSIIIVIYSTRLEIDNGLYECQKCQHKFVPNTYFSVVFARKKGTTKHLKCPYCNKKSWAKEENIDDFF